MPVQCCIKIMDVRIRKSFQRDGFVFKIKRQIGFVQLVLCFYFYNFYCFTANGVGNIKPKNGTRSHELIAMFRILSLDVPCRRLCVLCSLDTRSSVNGTLVVESEPDACSVLAVSGVLGVSSGNFIVEWRVECGLRLLA